MSHPTLPPLPIDPVLPALCAALESSPNAVLQAPPGAGKTTRVPLALIDQPWVQGGTILMLEPRRLAARAAARRMADSLGEEAGETVGYRVRLDSRVGRKTRIEVVTEGILTRRLQADPSLDGVAAVLFDEFHERSLQADLGLALCLEAQASLRPDLRLLVMSATLDGGPVAKLLGEAPIVTSEGRAFPVDTRFAEREPQGRIEEAVAQTVRQALRDETGSLLVFLPGQGEIRRVQGLLDGVDAEIAPLYGDLSPAEQDRAIRPCRTGQRKVVLATSIAETSITIDGVRVVVDCGLMRVPRFEPASGMTRLVTVPVSKASADQRRGRAGRTEPGVCYRLWTEAAHRALPAFTSPEIAEADLAPLALDLAQWGVADPASLAWLDAPPAAAYQQARTLLAELRALDADGRITAHGKAMAELPLHPRLGHMVLKGRDLGLGGLACELAALLSDRDVLRSRDADLRHRVELLRGQEKAYDADRGALARAREQARIWQRQLKVPAGGDVEQTGRLVALAYPDRIGQRRPGGEPRYRLSGGRGALFAEFQPLANESWLAVAHLDGQAREARIYLAAPVARADLEDDFAGQISDGQVVRWDDREQVVQARRQRRLFELVLDDKPLDKPDAELLAAALVEGIRSIGLHALPWSDAAVSLRQRLAFLHHHDSDRWPDMTDQALLDGLEDWLAPHLAGLGRRSHLDRLNLHDILLAGLDWPMRQALDDLAPTHVTVPTGNRRPIDYAVPEQPVLAVRLQEMFGQTETPRVLGGRVALTLHLLSPAQRPLAVTSDLPSFWAGAYRHVKADMKGQYPKHYWPDDPLQAEPTARAKPRK